VLIYYAVRSDLVVNFKPRPRLCLKLSVICSGGRRYVLAMDCDRQAVFGARECEIGTVEIFDGMIFPIATVD
jgi:hypothetical protein